ncbi:MAG: glycosyltransferase family A protein [Candidatus Sericytochromatia bacterium]|nr:glycosyltransferase family A protein [Candidatus Sericytochromatia bacterium]
MTPPRLAVAIPTYMRGDVLIATLKQVLQQQPPADEVLVIDQTPAHLPEVAAQLQAWADREALRWIRQSPANLPAARNRALRETRCEAVVFIDDDVVLEPGFLAAHRAALADPGVDAVAGKVVQARGWNHPKPPAGGWPRELDYFYFQLDSDTPARGIANFPGGNHAIRVNTARRLGGYDEAFVGWAFREESDMALRLYRAGGLIVYEPQAALLHLAAPAGGCRIDQPQQAPPEWQIAFPALYFLCKHFPLRRNFWYEVCLRSLRKYCLRRQILRAPWRLPGAFAAYGLALWRAWRLARPHHHHA